MAERANFTVEVEKELYEDNSEDDFEGSFDESDECGEIDEHEEVQRENKLGESEDIRERVDR